ncbi:hypothetical protein PNO30_03000 [Gemella haemolysans]|uniref:LPXTG-motif protein cell wall anchor domain protein n=1 Tax=Gemella haemolysans TaxID=1379 RepID=A0AAW6B5D8_9BACL|nr:hypothetical protein [Gemella haemolysans]MDB6185745.1 hypothetical protein [Gemella haemolysans]
MKTNKLLKVLSAATIISTLAVVDYSTTAQNNKVLLAADTQNPEVEVESVLMHAYENRPSMGNAALVKTTVQKVNNGYKYKVIWQNITFNGQNDGIGHFWVNESEVALNDVNYPGALNPKEAEFTLSTLESRIPVKVFVNIMDKIMPGQGKQSAFLQIKTDGLEEKLTPKAAETKPAESSTNPTTPSQPTPAKPVETKPVPKPETQKNVQPSNKPTEPTNTKPGKTPEKKSPTSPIKPVAKPNLPAQDQAQGQGEEKTVTYFDNVSATLLNAYEAGRASMGNAALDGITVYKDGSTYHYIVRFHDIKVGTLTDGITRFWVNGTEYPVTSTGGAMNQVQVHFTSGEQLTNIPVSVFVPTMESIMPGAGKKDAILSLDWSNASERQGTAFVDGGQPGSSANGNRALTPRGGRLNNGRLSNTGLETSSSILAGALTLISAVLVGRRKQK